GSCLLGPVRDSTQGQEEGHCTGRSSRSSGGADHQRQCLWLCLSHGLGGADLSLTAEGADGAGGYVAAEMG
ncbi:hypothetical protein NDU88_004032, partial [Pleurodeles waltl]